MKQTKPLFMTPSDENDLSPHGLLQPFSMTSIAKPHFALVRFGGGVEEMRGSFGGNTFSRNKGGAYVRSRTTPINPSTNFQEERRQTLANASQDWSIALTGTQRDAWNLYGSAVPYTNALGEVHFLSGQNMYVASRSLMVLAGLAYVNDAPTIMQAAAPPTIFTTTADTVNQELDVAFDNDDAWANEDDAALVVGMSAPKSAGRSFIGGPFRNAGGVLGNLATPPTSPVALDVPFPVAAGQTIRATGRVVRADGRISPFVGWTFLSA